MFQTKNAPHGFPINWSSQYSSHLAVFYSRAKHTFFTRGSEYELNLTDGMPQAFDDPNLPPHPDPALFIEVELETRRMLEESLRRFALAQLNNAGTNRVLCGAVAGVIMCLLGTIPPIALNFSRGHDRWSRLAAIPGFWVGLMVFMSALNGICIGVYIFGDLRQLRKFELARPTISKPQPIPTPRRHSQMPQPRPISETNSILPMQQPRKGSIPGSLHGFPPNTQTLSRMVSISSTRESIGTSRTTSDSSDGNVQVSPAYYDADEIDTSAIYNDEESVYRFPNDKITYEQRERPDSIPISATRHENNDYNINLGSNTDSPSPSPVSSVHFTTTAAFIHPFEFGDHYDEDDEQTFERITQLPERHQPMFPFDFDALPQRRRGSNGQQLTTLPSRRPSIPIIQVPAQVYPPIASSSQRTSTLPPTPTALSTPFMMGLSSSVSNPESPSPTTSAFPLRVPSPPAPPLPARPSWLARFQEKCGIARWRLQIGFLEPAQPYPHPYPSANPAQPREQLHPPHPSSRYWSTLPRDAMPKTKSLFSNRSSWTWGKRPSSDSEKTAAASASSVDGTSTDDVREEKTKRRLKDMLAVPAFAVPLTRVLSPVIVRGQWEIVIRSAIVALVISMSLAGVLLALPVPRR